MKHFCEAEELIPVFRLIFRGQNRRHASTNGQRKMQRKTGICRPARLKLRM